MYNPDIPTSWPERRARTGLKDLDNAIPHCVQSEVGDGVQIQLAHNVGAVSFSGFHTEVICDGYFLAGLAFRQQLDDFPLAGRQSIPIARFHRCRAVGIQVSVQYKFGYVGCKESSMALECFYSGDKIPGSV